MKHARTLWSTMGLIACLAGILVWITRSANETTAAPAPASHASPPTVNKLASAVGAVAKAPHQAAPEVERQVARGRLRGRFIDFHSGQPVEGAVYHARHEKGVSHSDESGEFDAFFGGGAIEFEAGAEGYCVVRGEITATLVDGRGALVIPLVAASPVRGVVVSEDGSTIPRPYVYTIEPQEGEIENPTPEGYPDGWRLYPEGLGGLVGDNDGRFELAGLVPGSTGYELQVSHVGFEKAVLEITTRAAGVPTVVDVLLWRTKGPPAGSITGHTYLNEEPVAATLWFLKEDDRKRARSDDEDGSYRFERIAPGAGRLVATPSDWMIVGEELIPEGSWIEGGQVDLVVTDGVELAQDFWMSIPMQTISGRVSRDELAAPEEDLALDLVAISELVWVYGETDAEGRYAIDVPVTGHDYRIHAGLEIVSPISAPVAPGAQDVDLVIDSTPSFTLGAVDAESGREVRIVGVRVRGTGTGEEWFTAHGPRYKAPLGPLDIMIRSLRHQAKVIQVHVAPGDQNHFTAELERR